MYFGLSAALFWSFELCRTGDGDPDPGSRIQERRQDSGIAAGSDSLLCHQLAVFLPPFPPTSLHEAQLLGEAERFQKKEERKESG